MIIGLLSAFNAKLPLYTEMTGLAIAAITTIEVKDCIQLHREAY